jgi:hypothetical protein
MMVGQGVEIEQDIQPRVKETFLVLAHPKETMDQRVHRHLDPEEAVALEVQVLQVRVEVLEELEELEEMVQQVL